MMMHLHLVQTFIVAPQALHLKEDFGATEGFLAIFGSVEVLAAALVTLFIPAWISRYGNRRVATFGMIGLALGAIGQGLMPNLYLTLLPAAINGAAWTVTFLAALGIYNERTSPNDYQVTNLWHQLLFAAMFVGPMLGSALVDQGLAPAVVLVIGGGLRFIAAGLTYFEGVIFKLKRELV
jgi:MFS family permease